MSHVTPMVISHLVHSMCTTTFSFPGGNFFFCLLRLYWIQSYTNSPDVIPAFWWSNVCLSLCTSGFCGDFTCKKPAGVEWIKAHVALLHPPALLPLTQLQLFSRWVILCFSQEINRVTKHSIDGF